MPARQLQLFPAARPLLETIGAEFFKSAPKAPGVYVMCGDAERILYIGQSKNLRARLASYKNARRDGTDRKTLRLACTARTITYEVCESAEAAILRESKLIALHKPRFNRAGVMPRAARFICVSEANGRLELTLTKMAEGDASHGPFTSGGTVVFAALCRCVWNLGFGFPAFETFPAGLLTTKPPFNVRVFLKRTEVDLHRLVTDFLSGTSSELLSTVSDAAAAAAISLCQKAMCEEDAEVLGRFYRKCARLRE